MLQILPGWSHLLRTRSRRNRRRAGIEGRKGFGTFAAAKGCPSTNPAYGRRPAFEMLEERAMLSVAQDLQDPDPAVPKRRSTPRSTSRPACRWWASSSRACRNHARCSKTRWPIIEQATQGIWPTGITRSRLPLTTISHTFTFDLGLDALLQVSTSGGVAGSITPTLNIGFDVSTVPRRRSTYDPHESRSWFQPVAARLPGHDVAQPFALRARGRPGLQFLGPSPLRFQLGRRRLAPVLGRRPYPARPDAELCRPGTRRLVQSDVSYRFSARLGSRHGHQHTQDSPNRAEELLARRR